MPTHLHSYDRDTDKHYLKDNDKMTNLSPPVIITPLEIADDPINSFRIIPFLEELRRLWESKPGKTFAQICRLITESEYIPEAFFTLSDEEFLISLQNYKDKS